LVESAVFGDPAGETRLSEHGISMPDEAREVVFPQGIPVTMLDGNQTGRCARGAMPEKGSLAESRHEELDAVSTKAEAGLYSEAVVIEEQARQAQPIEGRRESLAGCFRHHSYF
jgi:small conductance mechanosensitive channel